MEVGLNVNTSMQVEKHLKKFIESWKNADNYLTR
jgi:hypothetical protein